MVHMPADLGISVEFMDFEQQNEDEGEKKLREYNEFAASLADPSQAYRIKSQVLAFVGVNLYGVYRSGILPVGSERVLDINMDIKPKRSMQDLASEAGAAGMLGIMALLSEAMDSATYSTLRYLVHETASPLFERLCRDAGSGYPVSTDSDTLIYGSYVIPEEDGTPVETSYGTIGNDRVAITFSAYQFYSAAGASSVRSVLRMRFMHFDPAVKEALYRFGVESIPYGASIPPQNRFLEYTELEDHGFDCKDLYISYAMLGAQFSLDKLKAATYALVEDVFHKAAAGQAGYGPGIYEFSC